MRMVYIVPLNFQINFIRQGYNIMAKNIKILLVEDEVVTAMLVTMQLKRIGYELVEHVTTGEDAIVSARKNAPDIILMDIRLAGDMDGIEAAKVIQSEKRVSILFLTSYDDQVTRMRAEKLKPLAYLIKPLDVDIFAKIAEASFP